MATLGKALALGNLHEQVVLAPLLVLQYLMGEPCDILRPKAEEETVDGRTDSG